MAAILIADVVLSIVYISETSVLADIAAAT